VLDEVTIAENHPSHMLMATMIAKKHKGDFDTYFFVIDNLIKHANAKGHNRHVATGAMQPAE
jgi:hypothetical protein